MFVFFVLLILSLHYPEPRSFAAAQQLDECRPASCHGSGPMIRFPFRLTGIQPEHCGYPGFDLSCGSDKSTEFEFQFPVRASARNIVLPLSAKARVREIDYRNQVIRATVLNGSCFPDRVPEPVSTAPTFEFAITDESQYGYTLFNCSGRPDYSRGPITCLGHGGFQVYAVRSFYFFSDFFASNCLWMYNISYVPGVLISAPGEDSVDHARLHWSDPVCGRCEANGMYCRLRSNGTNNETECFEIHREHQLDKKVIAIVVVGVSLTALASATLLRLYITKKRRQENERRIAQFLEDYRALRPTRYTYSEVKQMTEGFKHQLGRGGYGTVFKGKLSSDIPVAVKVLNSTKGNGNDFINEVATIGKIHHVNVVRLVGYCADGYRRALVYEFLENDSLDKYVSSGSTALGWEKLREIAVGIAEGIDYLHWGCNQRILHFDIKPHNILLDGNLCPKVADFGLAKLCPKEQSVATMTARGTIGYIAPEVFSRNFGRVSYKSDIYSFGMLLLDMVGGRKNFDARGVEDGCSTEVYFPEWMYNQLEKGKDIVIQIEDERESEMAKRLIIVGLWCIQWYPADRPSMKVVVQMLRGETMPVMPPNPFAPSKSVEKSLTFGGSRNSSGTSSSIN